METFIHWICQIQVWLTYNETSKFCKDIENMENIWKFTEKLTHFLILICFEKLQCKDIHGNVASRK